jgi:hypothetical protein
MSDSFFALVLVCFVVLWLTGFSLQIATRRQLRAYYPDIASRIAPGLLRNNIGSSLAWIRFIIRREYRSLDRRGFVRLCNIYLVTLTILTVVFVVMVAALVHISKVRS